MRNNTIAAATDARSAPHQTSAAGDAAKGATSQCGYIGANRNGIATPRRSAPYAAYLTALIKRYGSSGSFTTDWTGTRSCGGTSGGGGCAQWNVAGSWQTTQNGSLAVSFTFQQSGTTVPLGEGVHTVVYWSADNAGNVESPHSIQVQIDKTPPTITATSPTHWVRPTKSPSIRTSHLPAVL